MKTKFITLATAAAMAFAAPAFAQQGEACLPRDKVVKNLQSKYSESLQGRGLQNEVRLVEIFASDDGSSWTIIQTYANGTSCLVAAGTNWMESKQAFLNDQAS